MITAKTILIFCRLVHFIVNECCFPFISMQLRRMLDVTVFDKKHDSLHIYGTYCVLNNKPVQGYNVYNSCKNI